MDIKQDQVQKQRFKKTLFNNDKFKNILDNKISCKSVWFMRQAGRYLP